MRDQAQIVIIGGGIIGCSIAYHLAEKGWTDVLLIEKGELTSGSTFHSAGLVSQFRTSPTLMQLMNYSINLYNQFKAELGAAVGWYPVGSLRLASSGPQLKQLQRQVSTAKALGLDVGIIPPAEALRIFPAMNDTDLYGAVHIPEDGWLEPNGITMEFARRAKQMGVEIQTNNRVTAIRLSDKGEVQSVETELGLVRTERLVNAAGQWAPRIGEMVGTHTAITPMMHQYLTTEPLPGLELPQDTPVLRDPDNLVYMREEVSGFLVGGFEPNPKAWSVDGVAWEFTEQLLAPEWDLFDVLMEGAIRRVPDLEKARVIKLVNGPEGTTPDGHYCLGPVPGIRGFHIAAGMSLNGLAGAGGVGKAMADWIVDGEPPWEMHELNIRRFGPQYADQEFRVERTRELYKYYYFLRFPFDEYEWGRPMHTSPLMPRLQELGAVFGEKNGWERVNFFETGEPWRRAGADQREWGWSRPMYFEQVGEEHEAARKRVALMDMTSFGKIDVRGPGALALLQRLTDNNVDKPVGSLTYTQFLNGRGGVESDLTVTRWGEEHFRLVSGTATVSNDVGWIQLNMNADEAVQVKDVTADWACVSLWGPRAREVLSEVTEQALSNADFPYLTARVIEVGLAEAWAQRVSYAGELGWELYVRPESALQLWDALSEAGAPFGIQPIGYKALDSLRLEKGYRLWGADMTPDENPYEAGLAFCVRLKTGGDFIGKDALILAKEQGIQRRLCTLNLADDSSVMYGGEAVYGDGQLVGRVRSGGYGYTVGRTIALVYLPMKLTEAGTDLEVEVFGERIAAQVAPDALHDPKGERLRA